MIDTEQTPQAISKANVSDKSNTRVFPANVQNVAAALAFYEVETAAKVLSTEHLLSELEGKAIHEPTVSPHST